MGEDDLATRKDRKQREAFRTLFLLPAAITLVAFYKDVFEIGHFLAELCRSWLVVWREIWERLFLALPEEWRTLPSKETANFLTLWVTLGGGAALTRLFVPHAIAPQKTAVELFGRMTGAAPQASFVLTVAAGALAMAIVVAPFNDWGSHLRFMFQAFLAGEWYALVTVVGLALVSTVLFWNGMTRSDVLPLASGFIVACSVACLLLALITTVTEKHGDRILYYRSDTWAFGATVFFLIFLCARSALPFIQLALLVAGVLLLDATISFLSEVWTAVESGAT